MTAGRASFFSKGGVVMGHWLADGSKHGGASARKALDLESGRVLVFKTCRIAQPKEEQEQLERDLCRLQSLQHPHVATILGFTLTADELTVKGEFFSDGSVRSLVDELGPLVGQRLKASMRGILEGLQHLHSLDPPIAHGNVKGHNVLITSSMLVKLADARCGAVGTCASSLAWAAPETVQPNRAVPSAAERCRSDLWSAACTFIEMATAEDPWGNEVESDSILCLLKGDGVLVSAAVPELPRFFPVGARRVASACLRRSPRERPLAADLLQYAYFATEN